MDVVGFMIPKQIGYYCRPARLREKKKLKLEFCRIDKWVTPRGLHARVLFVVTRTLGVFFARSMIKGERGV